jgi:bacteriorhodopsin
MEGAIQLNLGQYELVYNMLSLSVAAMFGAVVFFIGARTQVARPYRGALLISSVVVAIAGYHYFRILQSWDAATVMVESGVFAFDGTIFNDAYRYADWILTVPLLLVEAVAVLNLKREVSRPLIAKLSIAAALMIGLGYPGEVATDTTTRLIWGTLSTIPFAYILWVLWGELGRALKDQPDRVRILMRNLRLLLVGTWGVYPIAYLAPVLGFEGASALVWTQVGYSIADITAKAGFGVMIYAIAREKSRHESGDYIFDETEGEPKLAAAQ